MLLLHAFNAIMIITDKETRDKAIELILVNIEFDTDAVVRVKNIVLGKYVEHRWNYFTVKNITDSITTLKIVLCCLTTGHITFALRDLGDVL
jgi:hypothetical protein